MARSLSELAAKEAAKKFSKIENVFVKDALFFTGVSADTDLVSAGYTWASMYLFDIQKGVKEDIQVLTCIELENGDNVHTLVDFAKAKGFSASTEKPLNIVCYKTKIPIRYCKYSKRSSVNIDELL